VANLKITDLQALAASVGFPDPSLAAAVAMAESGGNPAAVGDPQYGGSYGLWQVNAPAHPNYNTTDLLDPTYNAQAAFAISSSGTNWNPWTTYRTGAYEKYLTAYSGNVLSSPALRTALIAGAILLSASFIASELHPGFFNVSTQNLRRRLRLA
jgi:soluble lytic murein transglycosylase-like protein